MYSDVIIPKGFLVILSAPSGGGKTTVYKELLRRNPKLEYSISVTTRKIRNHETNGVDYEFVTDEEFDRLVAEDKFAEWAHVHGNRYGTLRTRVDDSLSERKILLFDLDVQGAGMIKERYPDDAVTVFILPPSPAELRARLENRQTETEETIALRLKNALWEYGHIDNYDYTVINEDFDDCVLDIEKIIRSESLRIKRIEKINWKAGSDDKEI